MLIAMIERGHKHTINVQDCGKAKNAFLFLQMLNHFDPFIHERPFWQNSIMRAAMLNSMANSSAEFRVGLE